VRPTECLSACTNGCSIALTRPGSWTYVYGRLSDADVPDILAGAAPMPKARTASCHGANAPSSSASNPSPAFPAGALSHVSGKIPVTIVTGFLGSGKTTLIRHLLQNPGGRRLAVLVNEFGTVGVDGEILKACADENCPESAILELANGCICCTVADDFIPTVEKLLALPQRPDHILIETSGLPCPSRCSRPSTGPPSAAASPWTA
jgi:hypothetical protein